MNLIFSDMPMVIDKSKPSIFLVGPTLRNSSFDKSWRKKKELLKVPFFIYDIVFFIKI